MIIEPKRQAVDIRGAMGRYEIFATALILTPHTVAEHIYQLIAATADRDMAVGVSHLPNGCGLICRILGSESGEVKRRLRSICSTVREQVKARPMPDEFPWR